ncbi:MAG: hypothetical protein WC974_04645 [Thermoplasmata archaeon]
MTGEILSTFETMFILFFGIFTLIAGLLTAYFGTGRSKAIGGVLSIVGIAVVGILFYYKYIVPIDPFTVAYLGNAVIGVAGAVVGALAALCMFLVAIIKS